MKKTNANQFRVRSTANDWKQPIEAVFESEAEAEVFIREMRIKAIERKMAAEFRRDVGHPHATDYSDLKAVESFDDEKYGVVAEPMSSTIYRLNTLPSESSQIVREILFKLRHFDEVELGWTCTGHTRAKWQGEAAAAWLNKHGFAAVVLCDGDVSIRLAKGGAK